MLNCGSCDRPSPEVEVYAGICNDCIKDFEEWDDEE